MSVQVGDQWRISRAEQIRRAMGPDMCAVADALRTTFGPETKIAWLRAPPFELGDVIDAEPIGEKAWHGERRRE